MRRRMLLTAVFGVMVAGCSSADSTENHNTSEAGTETGRESTETETSEQEDLEQFESNLEDRGLEGVSIEPVGDSIELGYEVTGFTEDNVAAEIEAITDGYTTSIEEGLASTALDATAYDPATDGPLDQFGIETAWVDAYLEETLEWHALLTRIGETFESVSGETGDTDDLDDGDNDEDESEDSADSSDDAGADGE